MVLKRLLRWPGSKALTIGSLAVEAKRALERGNKLRAVALLILAALAWKWAALALVAQGLLRVFRRGGGSPSGD